MFIRYKVTSKYHLEIGVLVKRFGGTLVEWHGAHSAIVEISSDGCDGFFRYLNEIEGVFWEKLNDSVGKRRE
jgi:hypothetical protein